jgi:uncharacterized membrane protein
LTLVVVQLVSIAAVVVWAGVISLVLWLIVRQAAARAERGDQAVRSATSG